MTSKDTLYQPTGYIKAKLQQNDMVFLGTRHKQPPILQFIADLIPSLNSLGTTHIGLEIPSDQQERIDAFLRTGNGMDAIQFHPQIDHPDYRHLLQVLRTSGGPVPVAIDSPYSEHGGQMSRDEWMARTLLAVLRREPSAKILVIVGGLHILKNLEWEQYVPNKKLSIRQYIERQKPDIKMWSVGQLINENPDGCDFTKRFSSLPGAVALDLDKRHRGWKLGLTGPIAIVPAACFELVDGLIVY
jgi:hypothetical protein